MMSDPGSDFRLYHSNSLDVLAALLARNVRAPVPASRCWRRKWC
jgi:exodeoxyribonuclease V gamma subunit